MLYNFNNMNVKDLEKQLAVLKDRLADYQDHVENDYEADPNLSEDENLEHGLYYYAGYGEDLRNAVQTFENLVGMVRSYQKNAIAYVYWQKADIEDKLEDKDIPLEYIDRIIERIGSTVEDRSVEEGWEIIDIAIDIAWDEVKKIEGIR